MVNSEELIGIIECLALYTGCRITDVVITGVDCVHLAVWCCSVWRINGTLIFAVYN